MKNLIIALLVPLVLLSATHTMVFGAAHLDATTAQQTGTTGTVSEAAENNYLAPASHAGCVAPCSSFHAGALKSDALVCTYSASGDGTVTQNVDAGSACFPALNCREDWNVCVQWNKDAVEISPTHLPASWNLTNTTSTRSACEEINALIAGGSSGTKPPPGGWKPTTHGWRKGSGNIGCGWGSTYSGVHPTINYGLEDFGRIELENFEGDQVDCCMEAMKYDGVDIKHGGAAVRFDLFVDSGDPNALPKCRIDRELMLRGNLDSSGGRPLGRLDSCGEETERFFWREASGAADAANLQSAGKCVAQHGFTRHIGLDNTNRPLGRLPHGFEIPNHLSQCTTSNPENCYESLRYNAINTAESCCEACQELRWLPTVGSASQITPCVAFQIVDGKCHILRERWFNERYGSENKGTTAGGNKAMSVTEVIHACAGFKDHELCSRADNSHGHWASCLPSDQLGVVQPDVGEDCNYYSHIYYRDLQGGAAPSTDKGANSTFRKIQVITLVHKNNGSNLDNLVIGTNSTIVDDRTTKRRVITSAPTPPAGFEETDDVFRGFEHDHAMGTGEDNANTEDMTCARIALYLMEPTSVVRDAHTQNIVFNPETTIRHLHASNQCCRSSKRQSGTTASDVHPACELSMSLTKDFIAATNTAARNRRRRLGEPESETAPQYILAYECIGRGKDLCDSSKTGGNSLLNALVVPDKDVQATIVNGADEGNGAKKNQTINAFEAKKPKNPTLSTWLIVAVVLACLVVVGMLVVVIVKMRNTSTPSSNLTYSRSFSGLHGNPVRRPSDACAAGNGMLRKDSLSSNAQQQHQVLEMPKTTTTTNTLFGLGRVITSRPDGFEEIRLNWKLAGGSSAVLYRHKNTSK